MTGKLKITWDALSDLLFLHYGVEETVKIIDAQVHTDTQEITLTVDRGGNLDTSKKLNVHYSYEQGVMKGKIVEIV